RSAAGTVGGGDLREMLDVLGLASLTESDAQPVSDEVTALRDARERARQVRDWGEADRLREKLRALGWEVRDGPNGPELLSAG
ncbi:MAG: CysS/YqeB C-terminal domain-containing protein, partial [Solirubrobacteraceae bacterium]